MRKTSIITALLTLTITACSEDQHPQSSSLNAEQTVAAAQAKRWYRPDQVALGERLFTQHCASCHQPGATGDSNWRSRGPDGKFPPPPLNGTAHAWHHPLAQLRHTIANGGSPEYGNMPAWRDKLTDEEIDAVIAWFQSLWPEDVYQAWYEIDGRTRSR